MIFLNSCEFLERKSFPTHLVCTPWMWLTVLGTQEAGLCSCVCASNWCVTSLCQAGNIPRGEAAAVALTMDSSQPRLPRDTVTVCVPQVCTHMYLCTCLQVGARGCRLGCEVDMCKGTCSWLCLAAGESLCAGKALVACRAHTSKINHLFQSRFAIYKFPLL